MLRRLVPATAAAGLLLAGLTGCSAQQASAADCAPSLQPGALSDHTEVSGAFGQAPTVTVPDDLTIQSTQRTIAEHGDDGDDAVVAEDGTIVGVNMTFVDSETGDGLYASPGLQDPTASPELLLLSEDAENPLNEAVRCTVPGDRVVLALSPDDSLQLGMQLGSMTTAPIVGVLDVVTTAHTSAEGRAHGLPNGYPAVTTTEDGQPGIVLPPANAPTSTSSAVRIDGAGEDVGADDNVIAQVLAVGWDGQVRQNTWDSGLTGLGTETQIEQSGFTFRSELTGKSVGSQVVVVEALEGGDAQVVVVDILGIS